MSRSLVTTFVLGITLFVTATAPAAEVLRPLLVVRIYAIPAITAPDLLTARREATALLDLAGVEADWIDCRDERGVTPGIRCSKPLKRNEVAVRLVRSRGGTTGSQQPLGESLIDAQHRSGTLATIYLDRVEWLARAGRANPAAVLGRALAHELGHLLLGTRDHNTSGLMRPIWTRDELRRGVARDWQFTTADAAGMQAGLARRTHLENIVWATE